MALTPRVTIEEVDEPEPPRGAPPLILSPHILLPAHDPDASGSSPVSFTPGHSTDAREVLYHSDACMFLLN
jgi:hypothetical protein